MVSIYGFSHSSNEEQVESGVVGSMEMGEDVGGIERVNGQNGQLRTHCLNSLRYCKKRMKRVS